MRNELENIERIEKYLRNELGAEDKIAFEEQLKTDQSLQSQLKSQKEAVEGIERLGAKDSIQTAYKGYKLRKTGLNLGLGGLLILVVTAGIVWASTPSSTEKTAASKKIEKGPQQAPEEFKVPETFMADIESYVVDPTEATALKIGSEGTVLHIPESAFVDDKGAAVTSPVTITFQEYKDAADMAFSEIPMTYTEGAEEYNFNSSGMFSIKGYADGKEVAINPETPLSIDYTLAKQNPDIDFYKLKDDETNWDLVQEIDEQQVFEDSIVAIDVDPSPINGNIVLRKNPIANSSEQLTINPVSTSIVEPMDPAFVEGTWPESAGNDPQMVWNNGKDNFVAQNANQNGGARPDNGDRTTGTLMAPGAGAGHTYPPVIAALNIPSFGVYNCDQIYRVPNRVNINSIYVDEKGKAIEGAKMISLIDLKYNGAFSFDAENFTCDSKGDNVIMLFTYSRQLYVLEKGDFAKMKISNNGTYTFKMKNVTETLKSTRDLRIYLGF